MDCPRSRDVSDFADGELPPAAAENVRAHLVWCDACADWLLFIWWLDAAGQALVARGGFGAAAS